jgi:hypothetical protein
MANKAKTKITIDRFSATVTAIHRYCPFSRIAIHWSRQRIRPGTLMRYFIVRRWGFSSTLVGADSELRLSTGGIALTLEGVSIGLVRGTQGSSTLLL